MIVAADEKSASFFAFAFSGRPATPRTTQRGGAAIQGSDRKIESRKNEAVATAVSLPNRQVFCLHFSAFNFSVQSPDRKPRDAKGMNVPRRDKTLTTPLQTPRIGRRKSRVPPSVLSSSEKSAKQTLKVLFRCAISRCRSINLNAFPGLRQRTKEAESGTLIFADRR